MRSRPTTDMTLTVVLAGSKTNSKPVFSFLADHSIVTVLIRKRPLNWCTGSVTLFARAVAVQRILNETIVGSFGPRRGASLLGWGIGSGLSAGAAEVILALIAVIGALLLGGGVAPRTRERKIT